MEIDAYIVADDRQLVALALEGDDAAFGHLFNRYREAISRLFLQKLSGAATGPADADDLLQETFVKVYVNLHRYSPRFTFGQWLYTIARNTFIDHVRRRSDDLSLEERFEAPASSAPTPEESVIRQQQRRQIELYLTQLPPRYRQLFELRFYDECSYEEIAEKLELPLGTVKTGIHRMRERLCRLIAEGERQ